MIKYTVERSNISIESSSFYDEVMLEEVRRLYAPIEKAGTDWLEKGGLVQDLIIEDWPHKLVLRIKAGPNGGGPILAEVTKKYKEEKYEGRLKLI